MLSQSFCMLWTLTLRFQLCVLSVLQWGKSDKSVKKQEEQDTVMHHLQVNIPEFR